DQENYEVKTLLLPSTEKIPDDATVVILAGPTHPLTDAAVAALDGYLKRGGHLLAMVGPRDKDPKVQKLLLDWAAKLGDDIVIDREVRLLEGPRLGVQPIVKTYGAHPITQGFRDITIFSQTRTVEPAVEGRKGIEAVSLLKTSNSSWAESHVDELFNEQKA